MGTVTSYVKAVSATSYAAIKGVVSYARIVVSNITEGVFLGPTQLLADTSIFSESGYLAGQDYVDPTYFLTGDYVADQYRTF